VDDALSGDGPPDDRAPGHGLDDRADERPDDGVGDMGHDAPPAEGLRVLGVVFLEDILEELVGEVRDAMQRRAP
jgi:hypothetical protein